MLFLVLLLCLPVIEIALFIQVGDDIGVMNTLLLCILSAVFGVFMVQKQGLDTLFSMNQATNRGEMPVQQIFDGICIVLGGVLLIIPGFFTDFIGLILLIPPLRPVLRQFLAQWVQVHGFPGQPRPHATDTVLDVEYEEVREEDVTPKLGPARDDDTRS